MIKTLRALALISLLSVGSITHALPILTPTGLNPGDTYQLAFVTSTSIDATSTDIAVYNTHVQDAANAKWLGGGTILDGVTWSAIGSTPTVDARDNAMVFGRVFNLADGLIASDLGDMWDGSLAASISTDENGSILSLGAAVWTGTASSGVGAGLGNTALGGIIIGGGQVTRGVVGGFTNGSWIEDPSLGSRANLSPMYALSNVITVPQGTAPAPATLALFGLGLAGLGFSRRKR